MLRAGYRGPLSLEVFNDVFRQADPDRMAVDAMRSLLLLEEVTGRRATRSPVRGPAGPLTPAPPLSGFAFAELAVDPHAARAAEATLGALGFTPAGHHRFKPVTRWRAGEANVLVNARPHRTPGAPTIGAIAVETADPSASARRATALLAPMLARDRGPIEADLPAVTAPDGTAVFFCRSDPDDPESWVNDFPPFPAPADGHAAPAACVSGIDHVALTQPFDLFDEAALFYRAVLGLELDDNRELAAPAGLVRSRSAGSPGGDVRLAMNAPLLPGGDVAARQHLALATGDALAAARRLRAHGVSLLEISANYYDDLAARLDLDPALLEAMRDLGVLYDRGRDGELLHFYTAAVGSNVLVEVVERRGGYDGYGAANAPVRLAAQREPSALAAPPPRRDPEEEPHERTIVSHR